jgi:hypothetical protein
MEKLKRIREGKSTKRASVIIPESIFTKVEEELVRIFNMLVLVSRF